MSQRIRKVAVLGAGVMGSAIAAHLANAGIPSLLLDIVPPKPDAKDDVKSKAFRNKFAAGALANMKKQKPAPLFTPRALDLIEVGNFDDDLARIGECDWIVEVVKEDMAVKQAIFAKVDQLRKQGSVVSSNTSGMSIKGMMRRPHRRLQEELPRHALLQPRALHEAARAGGRRRHRPRGHEALARFGEELLGKGIVYGKDTTNFVANRIGMYGMMPHHLARCRRRRSPSRRWTRSSARRSAAPSAPCSAPPTSSASTPSCHVAQNCYDSLTGDEEREVFKVPEFVDQMVEQEHARRQDRRRLLQEGEGRRRREADPRARSQDAAVPAAEPSSATSASARPRTSRIPRRAAWP